MGFATVVIVVVVSLNEVDSFSLSLTGFDGVVAVVGSLANGFAVAACSGVVGSLDLGSSVVTVCFVVVEPLDSGNLELLDGSSAVEGSGLKKAA